MFAITLEARSELGCDLPKVVAIISQDPWGEHLQAFSTYKENNSLVMVFGTRGDKYELFNSMSLFLDALLKLPDCHRICETLEFQEQYTGEVVREARAQLNYIRTKLLLKISQHNGLHT